MHWQPIDIPAPPPFFFVEGGGNGYVRWRILCAIGCIGVVRKDADHDRDHDREQERCTDERRADHLDADRQILRRDAQCRRPQTLGDRLRLVALRLRLILAPRHVA